MKKLFVISLIFSLILLTAIVKNSTKRINDEIFTTREEITDLKKNYENFKLEFEFLSSSKKLFEFKRLYFDDELVKKDLKEIDILDVTSDELKFEELKLNNE